MRTRWIPILCLALACGGPAPEIPSSGQTYDVQILRDSWGVPHIFGARDADVAFGLAWAHAEDDFATIQESLLISRGSLAAVRGRDAARYDFLSRWLRVQDVAREAWERDLSPEARAVAEAYADGINRYGQRHPDQVLRGALPVTGVDLAAGFVFQNAAFVAGGQLARLLDEDRALEEEKPEPPRGSNSFAVAPRRSADGHTRLAVNSHQPWTGPVAWYEAHLRSDEGWEAVGGVFPGSPVILHGHNRHLGWAHTVNQPDLVDVFRLEIDPEDPNRYRFDGEWRELERREIPIRVRLWGPFHWTVQREVLGSVHGPVVRRKDGTFAVRFAGIGEGGMLEQIYRMNRAQNLDEFRAAMRLHRIAMFNTLYADEAGNVWYVYNAKLPLRADGHDWSGVVDGSTSETLWSDYLPFDALPQVTNPASGFAQNCNNTPYRTTDGTDNPRQDDFDPNLGVETRMTNRALRALELFGPDASITRDEFFAYKFDMAYSEGSDEAGWVRQLLEAGPPEDPELREAWDRIAAWDLGAEPTNRGTAIGILTLLPYWNALRRGLEPPSLLELLGQAADTLREHHGKLDPPWEQVNRLRRGDLDLGVGGGPDILHAVYAEPTEDGRMRGVAGDSYVLMVDWGPRGVRSRSIHQFGSATLDASSPHYADQAVLFAKRMTKPVWLDEQDVRANLIREYVPAGATP
jgi:penicillin amidase/acyl-homoserine-lactone acylase